MADRTFVEDVLPPEGLYESRESLLAAINSWAKPRGYAFTTGKSTKTSNGRVKVVFACDRNKKPPSSSVARVRNTSSRRTGCKFSVLAKQSRDGGTWVLTHRPDGECAKHNHPPSEDPSAHPAHRRFEEQDATTVSNLAISGIPPREIRSYLHNNSDSLATQRDVYNRIAATKRNLREGQSSIQALVDQLHEEGFWCHIRLDQDNRLTGIFFAHPDSIAYLQCNPDVLLLDCTYKTNKHQMPLLDMVGVDSCQRSFCIAFAFLSGETEEDYSWALENLRSLYQRDLPSVILTDRCLAAMNAAAIWFSSAKPLLCIWHVNKAVLQYCRPFFISKNGQASSKAEEVAWGVFYAFWHSIVASPDEKIFEERLARFEEKYSDEHPESVGYIKTYWLDPYKEMIVKAWVDKHMHFGNVATSRQVACGVWRGIGTNQLRIPLDVSGVLFEAVRGWVSCQALRKVQEQRLLLQKPHRATCSQAFTASHGLPCAHKLKELEGHGQSLLLEHFHPHWHLKRGVAQPPPILEPFRATYQVKQKITQPATSTRREPCGFETIEGRQRAPSKCSKCHALGHTMTSRACPLRFKEPPSQEALVSDPTAPICSNPALAPTDASDLTICESVQARSTSCVADVILPFEARRPAPVDMPTSPVPSFPQLPAQADLGSSVSTPQSKEVLQTPTNKEGPLEAHPAPVLSHAERYDSPQAIYARYVSARDAWYKEQPAGSIRTNQQYRKAVGLPQRYDKQSYEWCLDYKQMSKRCSTATGSREWTKEEMMAYLDWSKAEDERVEAVVAKELCHNPWANNRRGMKDVWRSAEKDSREQQALHSKTGKVADCIVVKP